MKKIFSCYSFITQWVFNLLHNAPPKAGEGGVIFGNILMGHDTSTKFYTLIYRTWERRYHREKCRLFTRKTLVLYLVHEWVGIWIMKEKYRGHSGEYVLNWDEHSAKKKIHISLVTRNIWREKSHDTKNRKQSRQHILIRENQWKQRPLKWFPVRRVRLLSLN